MTPAKAIAGFAVSQTFVGVAIVLPGREPALRVTRVVRGENVRISDVRVRCWVEAVLVEHAVSLAAVLEEDAADDVGALLESVRRGVDRAGLAAWPITRSDLTRALALEEDTNAAICGHLGRTEPALAGLLGPSRLRGARGPRTDAERYREMAVVALAAVRAVERTVRATPSQTP